MGSGRNRLAGGFGVPVREIVEVNPSAEIIELVDGYDRRKEPRVLRFRPMAPREALQLSPGSEVSFRSINGQARRARVSGAVRTWKRDPKRIELPIKYGMYESARFVAHEGRMVEETNRGIGQVILLVEVGDAG